jgi:Methylase involved in ubiquinone/menaquinone biosynthesis
MFTLERVVPWGRSFDEYRRMFDLSSDDLRLRILGCADGPASFNAEATAAGFTVRSCDPLYRFGAADIARRIADTTEVIIEQTRRNQEEFVWNFIHSVDELRILRVSTMERFLADFETGKSEGRYVDAELPALPFDDGEFDLALCSHFLFLYSEQFSEEFHLAAIREMNRVAGEVRIFPLLALGGAHSPYLEPVSHQLRNDRRTVTIDVVPYEFQRGGNQMMRVRSAG